MQAAGGRVLLGFVYPGGTGLALIVRKRGWYRLMLFRRVAFHTLFYIALTAGGGHLHAAQHQANPQNYRALLQKLQPGDEVVLEPGVYRRGLPLHDVRGTAEQPIVIRGPVSGAPAIFVAREGANTVSLLNTEHVVIRNLILDGSLLSVDAVKAEGSRACKAVHHITLQDLLITGHGIDQQIVGISTQCPAWNWVIRSNIIIGAGTGLYLGGSDGSKPFVGGLIEHNIVLDTLGYNMQIKHQIERTAGIGMPTEPGKTVIRQNLFVKSSNAAKDKLARPNLLLGHFPWQGPGSDDIYEVTDNVFFCNATEALLQGEGNVTLRGNVLLNPAGVGVAIQPHNDVPKNIDITRNFIATAGRGVSLVKPSPQHRQTMADNVSIAAEPPPDKTANTPATLSDFATPLAHWLEGNNAFEPLARTAARICSPAANSELRDHPVCALVAVLNAPRNAAAVKTLDAIARKRCVP